MSNADELVAAYVLRQYREETWRRTHLVACDQVVVEHPGGEDGYYGCDTGCEYVRFTATLKCPHGESEEVEYGEFSRLADILEDLEKEANEEAP